MGTDDAADGSPSHWRARDAGGAARNGFQDRVHHCIPTVIDQPHKDCAPDVMEPSTQEEAMKSSDVRGLCLALGLLGLVQPLAAAEPFGAASLLPMPSNQPLYPLVAPASYGGFHEDISPSDQPAPAFPPPPVGSGYQQAMQQSWQSAGTGNAMGAINAACCRPCPRFAVWGGGLVLGRAHLCDRPLTLDANSQQTVMGSDAASQKWAGGFETGAAWIMPNCCNAIAVNYWGLFPSCQGASVNATDYPSGIQPILGNIDRLNYNDGTTTDTVFNRMTSSSGTQTICTMSSYNSVEVNFLGNTQAWGLTPFGAGCGGCNGCAPCGGCGPARWQFGWLGGFRYFRFNDTFQMQSDGDDTIIGQTGDMDELTYGIQTTNSLLGLQMGGQAAWYLCDCFSLYGSGRFGAYNNYITSNQYVAGQGGDAFINAGSFNGTPYRFNSSRNALAGIGQIDLGARYQLGCHWSLYGGYRVVGLAGVATSVGQINQNFANPKTMICANEAILLHGAFLGAQYAW